MEPQEAKRFQNLKLQVQLVFKKKEAYQIENLTITVTSVIIPEDNSKLEIPRKHLTGHQTTQSKMESHQIATLTLPEGQAI